LLNDVFGTELARVGAIVAGIGLAFICSAFFSTIDRHAVELSRRLRRRLSGAPYDALPIGSDAERLTPAE
jgi:hypothetical protein